MKTDFNKKEVPAFMIFLDIDGVIADFDSHAIAHSKKDAGGGMLWDALDFEWWKTMPSYDGAKEFYDTLVKIAPVKFLTAPIVSTECFYGKAEWVTQFVPEKGKWALMDLIICPSTDKHFLTRPNTILIDDRQKNIDDWVNAGGVGILHKGDYADTLKRLNASIKPQGSLLAAVKKLKF